MDSEQKAAAGTVCFMSEQAVCNVITLLCSEAQEKVTISKTLIVKLTADELLRSPSPNPEDVCNTPIELIA